MKYEEDIRIDDSALDIEWLEQAGLFMKYARHCASTRRAFDDAKQDLDIKKAELDKAIRENPSDYGIEKVTENAVASCILTHKMYKEAFQVYLDAKYEMEMAQYAVQAFNQRKEALENLVKLNGQQYFAGPKIPRDITWEREAKAKKVDTGVAGVLTRNKNK